MKTCPKCGGTKPLTDFSKNKSRRDGRDVWCKACAKTARVYNPKVARAQNIKRYGITLQDYEDLLCMCDAKCMVCGQTASEHKQHTGKFLCVDHDHITGKVRGLLCHRCNLVVGRMEDNPDLLVRAASYLTDRS